MGGGKSWDDEWRCSSATHPELAWSYNQPEFPSFHPSISTCFPAKLAAKRLAPLSVCDSDRSAGLLAYLSTPTHRLSLCVHGIKLRVCVVASCILTVLIVILLLRQICSRFLRHFDRFFGRVPTATLCTHNERTNEGAFGTQMGWVTRGCFCQV
jgi:hypothetical protein